MHARFQPSRRPRSGYGFTPTYDTNAYFGGSATPNTIVDASGTKTKGGMSDSKWSDVIGGLKDVAVAVTQTVGGIEQARLAGKSSTGGGSTYQPSTGSTYQPSGGGSGGISGTTIAIGVGVVAVLAVGGYFVFRKK